MDWIPLNEHIFQNEHIKSATRIIPWRVFEISFKDQI